MALMRGRRSDCLRLPIQRRHPRSCRRLAAGRSPPISMDGVAGRHAVKNGAAPIDDVWTGRGRRRSLAVLRASPWWLARRPPERRCRAPKIGGCPVFPPSRVRRPPRSAANQTRLEPGRLQGAGRRAGRATTSTRITSLGGNQVVHPDFGGNGAYGIPYTTVGPRQRRVRVKVTGYPDQSDFGRAPIPANAPVENGSDRHVLVLQRHRCDLFEMFAAHYVGGHGHRWNAGSTARFNLRSTEAAPRRLDVGRRGGASDPPGLVRYGEVQPRPRPPRDPGHLRRRPAAPTSTPPPTTPRTAATRTCRRWACGCGSEPAYFHDNLAPVPGRQPVAGDLQGALPLRDHQRRQRRHRRQLVHHRRQLQALEDGDLNRLKSVPGTAFVVVESRAPVTTPC